MKFHNKHGYVSKSSINTKSSVAPFLCKAKLGSISSIPIDQVEMNIFDPSKFSGAATDRVVMRSGQEVQEYIQNTENSLNPKNLDKEDEVIYDKGSCTLTKDQISTKVKGTGYPHTATEIKQGYRKNERTSVASNRRLKRIGVGKSN